MCNQSCGCQKYEDRDYPKFEDCGCNHGEQPNSSAECCCCCCKPKPRCRWEKVYYKREVTCCRRVCKCC